MFTVIVGNVAKTNKETKLQTTTDDQKTCLASYHPDDNRHETIICADSSLIFQGLLKKTKPKGDFVVNTV